MNDNISEEDNFSDADFVPATPLPPFKEEHLEEAESNESEQDKDDKDLNAVFPNQKRKTVQLSKRYKGAKLDFPGEKWSNEFQNVGEESDEKKVLVNELNVRGKSKMLSAEF